MYFMFSKFNPNDKVLVLDFDHNCYDTDAFLLFEIRQKMLNKFNISAQIWQDAYESAVKIGYSLEQHLKELVKILNYEPCSLKEMKDFEKEINFDKRRRR